MGGRGTSGTMRGAAAAAWLALVPAAAAQTPPAAEPAPQTAPAAPAPPAAPGLPTWEQLNEMSRQFWQRAFEQTTQAIDTTRRLATGTMVRETRSCRMPAGSNDCEAAAREVCAAKGYGDGRPLDTLTKETCPAPVRLGLRPAEPGECRIDHSIAAASCW